MDAIGVQEGVEVGADLNGRGAGGEAGGSFKEGKFRRRLVGDVGCVGLDAAASRLGIGMPGRISGERVVAMLRGQVHIDELPARDEIPLESLRGELR